MIEYSLQKGNMVLIDNLTLGKVIEIREKHVRITYIRSDTGSEHTSLVEFERLHGVPLNKVWLQNYLGFSLKKTSGIGGADMWQGMDFWVNGDITFRGDASHLCLAGYFNTQITFVHEMQNLMLSLTNKKIEVSLT